MIIIQQDQLNQNIKHITTASVDDYANAIRSVANFIGTVVAFTLTVIAITKAAYKHPLAALDQWTKPASEAVAAPVKERPTKSVPRPRPAAPAVNELSEKPAPAVTPKRVSRARKKRTLVTA
ncbi:hypothetical protein [Synechococcus sp. WH 8016]|uniref:hypothetical protein n=1 Tax=Synechococcus sp. WH 8016 TaxID=166318 RepID=UPI00022D7D68|nr:hypothetical protein [Synechococcus sp. WH 8016]EHA63756.1 hypothetical protein Syn8016DRAFT_0797 [Synechococcus sp. WH 8016]